MPSNFIHIAAKYIGGYIAYMFLVYLFSYLSSSINSGFSIIAVILSVSHYIVFGLALGYGLRELLRTNNYKISVGSVLAFGAMMAIIPTLFGGVAMYFQSFSNEMMASTLSTKHYFFALLFSTFLLFIYALFIISIIGKWLVYKKAGKKGWYSIVPFLNVLTIIRIIKKPESLFFLLLVPLVNLFVYFQILNDLAFAFKKSSGFAVGLFFLPFIFFPILGFGEAQYRYENHERQMPDLKIEDHLVTN